MPYSLWTLDWRMKSFLEDSLKQFLGMTSYEMKLLVILNCSLHFFLVIKSL